MARRPYGFLSNMSDRELLKYTSNLHGKDITRGELYKKDQHLYDELGKRGLREMIKTVRNRIGLWKTYEEWKDYGMKMKYNERNPKSLVKSEKKEERSWYYKGITENKNKKWLTKFPFQRKINRKGHLQDWDNFEREMWEAIKENKGEFPSYKVLWKMRCSSLSMAMVIYHGGKYVVMERIGYYEKKREELANELEEILEEI